MRKSMVAILLAGTVSLSACTTSSEQAGNIAQGAAIGGTTGVVAGAVIPGVSVIEGAAIGAAVGGLAGAVWADNNNDGYADGYVQNGQYYSGTPQGYDPTLRRVATGALIGGAVGAGAGAVIGGLSPITGAVIGAAVGGLAGAVWADNDRDGSADGYVYNGQYYQGQPAGYNTAPAPAPAMSSGERG
jgi:hypothetical protein